MGFLYNSSESGGPDKLLEDENTYIKWILEAFTYLLIAIGIVMILKLYFQTVLIFAKYFPYITLPLYVLGAWVYSAGLLYFAWDIMEDDGGTPSLMMTYPQVAMFQQGMVVGAVFLMIAPFTLLMPRLRFGRSSADADSCCKTICFPTFVWVVFLFIVLLCGFAGYCLLTTLLTFYKVTFFKAIGLEGIFVLLLLFYLFALFQIIAQRKIIVSGENILGKLREPFKCLHTRPYLFIYIFVLIFFSLGALGLDGLYAFKSYQKYTNAIGATAATTAVKDTAIQCMAIIGAFSGFSALYVLIGLTIALVISCSPCWCPGIKRRISFDDIAVATHNGDNTTTYM